MTGPYASKKEILSWCLYDFANSAYATLILTVAYSVYFTNAVVGSAGGVGDRYWGLTLTISNALVALSAPAIGAIADLTGSKKRFLTIYALAAIMFTGSLFLVRPGNITLGMTLAIISNFAFAGANVFYNAFLPELGPEEKLGRISGYGWALGYVGGLLALFLCLPLLKGGWNSPGAEFNYRLSFIVVAVHYLLFSIPIFLFLKEKAVLKASGTYLQIATLGWARLISTFREVRRYRQLTRFFAAFFLYNDGISTTIGFATIFAVNTIGFNMQEVTILFIILQTTAIAGAFIFGHVVDRFGAKPAITATLIIWCATAIGAYLCQTKAEFYVVGLAAGLAMGSSQSASRSMVALLSPPEKITEFYGFFGACGKFSAIIGPLLFGFVSEVSGNQRLAVLSVLVFFALGLVILSTVNEKQGRADRAQFLPVMKT